MASSSKTENWRPIAGHPAYEVSDLGHVRRLQTTMMTRWGTSRPIPSMMLTTFICKRHGYLQVYFKRLKRDVHRLVAMAFLGEPPFPKAQVNHKNGIRHDARLENLEWVTASENAQHSFHVLGRQAQNRIPVIARCLKTGAETVYPSGAAAARAGFNAACISDVCNGRAKYHAGFHWRFGAQNGVTFKEPRA